MARPALVCYPEAIKLERSGVGFMKWVKRAAVAAAIIGVAAAAPAQSGGYSGMQFVGAVRSGDNGKALELLKSFPTVINARDANGETALHAAVAGRDSSWTGHLLRQGADPDLAARNGDTPLIAAARIGFMDAAEWLLSSDAEVDLANRMGETALIVAVQNRRTAIVRLLLNAGADPDRSDSAAGLSALDYARRDTRSRDILRLIEAARTKQKAEPGPKAQ